MNGTKFSTWLSCCIAVILLVLLHRGECYRCYECDSESTFGCIDTDTKFLNLIECSRNDGDRNSPVGCKKIIKKTGDGLRVIRGCLKPTDENEFPDSTTICTTPAYTSNTLCRCYHDRCNGAWSTFRFDNPINLVLSLIASCWCLRLWMFN